MTAAQDGQSWRHVNIRGSSSTSRFLVRGLVTCQEKKEFRLRFPKTHADAGLFLLLKAAELSLERQKEIVVQLDVKIAFDHMEHGAALKAMRLQRLSLFSMALTAAIWSGSCTKARLGTVLSNKVQTSRGLPQAALESLVIFTMIMELVVGDLVKSWKARNLAWSVDDLVLADGVVLAAASAAAAEVMVADVIEKLGEVGLTIGA